MWAARKVLITGGASFIGSHLTDRLIELGADVLVVDNMSSGRFENFKWSWNGSTHHPHFNVRVGAMQNPTTARAAMVNREVVFHLAAAHGGRGFVDTHELECATNMILDQNVLHEAEKSRHVKYVVYTSSACVYPLSLQEGTFTVRRDTLSESDVGPPYDADHLYGWAKLMGEMVMNEHIERGNFHGTSLRYFTVYGPRMGVSHAIGAWIIKARAKQSPFLIWGDGMQTRSWVYVDDVVEATIAAAENLIMDRESNSAWDTTPRAINVGSPFRHRAADAALKVMELTGYEGRVDYDRGQPTGPRHRAADVTLAKETLEWGPTTTMHDGLKKTIEWFYDTYTEEQAVRMLQRLKER